VLEKRRVPARSAVVQTAGIGRDAAPRDFTSRVCMSNGHAWPPLNKFAPSPAWPGADFPFCLPHVRPRKPHGRRPVCAPCQCLAPLHPLRSAVLRSGGVQSHQRRRRRAAGLVAGLVQLSVLFRCQCSEAGRRIHGFREERVRNKRPGEGIPARHATFCPGRCAVPCVLRCIDSAGCRQAGSRYPAVSQDRRALAGACRSRFPAWVSAALGLRRRLPFGAACGSFGGFPPPPLICEQPALGRNSNSCGPVPQGEQRRTAAAGRRASDMRKPSGCCAFGRPARRGLRSPPENPGGLRQRTP